MEPSADRIEVDLYPDPARHFPKETFMAVEKIGAAASPSKHSDCASQSTVTLYEYLAVPLLVVSILTRNTLKAISYWRTHREVSHSNGR